MGCPSTRRVTRRSAPANITIVEGKGAGGDAAEKENMVNCSLYSLFETHYERSNTTPSVKARSQESTTSGTTDKRSTVLQPRKRLLNNRTVPSAAAEHSRELTPPELTTSDTFKPATRTLAPSNKAGDEGFKQLPHVRIPVPITSESCDVLVSSPTELMNATVPDMMHCKTVPSGRRDVTKKTPTSKRRLSIVRLSLVREGGTLPICKKNGNSTLKKSSPTVDLSVASPVEPDGRDAVFSAPTRTPLAEHSNRVQSDVGRGRLKVLERRKSIGQKMTTFGKQPIGSFSGSVSKKQSAEKLSPVAAPLTNPALKNTSDRIKTQKLAMVLKSEQRLAEKNERAGIKVRQFQAQIEERDHEVEKLRSAALMLNNLINRQGDEIRELRFRLKDAFNENSQVRQLCDTLERDLYKTREDLRLARIQTGSIEPNDPNLVSLTSQLQSMTICMESCIEESQEEFEGFEGRDGSRFFEDPDAEGVATESCTIMKELPLTHDDKDTQFTLQDLQEMVKHEEDLLKERCVDALRELNLPLAPLLTSKGSLDVDAVKAMLVSISSEDEYLTPDRISSIHKLSDWLGLS